MAALVKSALDDFELSARFVCLTIDNASNNDTLVTVLDECFNKSAVDDDLEAGVGCNPEKSRIRCLPHIINLAVKAFLNCLAEDEES
jgi:hypothetical protein